MYKAKKLFKDEGKRASWIKEEDFQVWKDYWEHPDVVCLSMTNSENRLSEQNDRKGKAVHHLGSQSAATAVAMSKVLPLSSS